MTEHICSAERHSLRRKQYGGKLQKIGNKAQTSASCRVVVTSWAEMTRLLLPKPGVFCAVELLLLVLITATIMQPVSHCVVRGLVRGCAFTCGNFFHSFIHPSIPPSIHPFIHPSIHPSFHPFNTHARSAQQVQLGMCRSNQLSLASSVLC